MLALKNVTKAYGKRMVLSDASFRVDPGECVCITGVSGSGKTTILSLLIGAETPTKGTVEIDGVDLSIVPPEALQLFRRRVGVVFQDYKLLPHRTVAENIAFPLEVAGAPGDWIVRRVREVLKEVGLTDRDDAFPSELSGGEQARAAVGRAIAHQPLIILADEPTANLDAAQAKAMIDLLSRIRDQGATLIVTTHDTTLAQTLKARALKLDNGKLSGARAEATRAVPVQTERKHDVFGAIEHKPSDDTGRRIRITSIHSDL